MYSKLLLLAVVSLAVMTLADDEGDKKEEGGGGMGRQRGFGMGPDGWKKCCPKFPELLTEDSFKACRPPRPEGPPPEGPPPEEPPPEESGSGGGSDGTPPPPAGEGPSSPPTDGPSPTPGEEGGKGHCHHRHWNQSCVMECVFRANNLLTTVDGKEVVNMDEVIKKLDAVAKADEAWETIITTAKKNCTATTLPLNKKDICKSGSHEVFRCLIKVMVPNCPNRIISKDCDRQKEWMSGDHKHWHRMRENNKEGKRGGRGKKAEEQTPA